MNFDIIVDNTELRIERLELSTYEANAYIVVCPETGESVLIKSGTLHGHPPPWVRENQTGSRYSPDRKLYTSPSCPQDRTN